MTLRATVALVFVQRLTHTHRYPIIFHSLTSSIVSERMRKLIKRGVRSR